MQLEWCSVQLHGHVFYNTSLVDLPKSLKETLKQPNHKLRRLSSLSTVSSMPDMDDMDYGEIKHHLLLQSLQRQRSHSKFLSYSQILPAASAGQGSHKKSTCNSLKSFSIFRCPSSAEVITAALTAHHGEVKRFYFSTKLPDKVPPSFNGVSTKICYFLTIGAKVKAHESAKMLHVPIKVIGNKQERESSFLSYQVHDYTLRVGDPAVMKNTSCGASRNCITLDETSTVQRPLFANEMNASWSLDEMSESLERNVLSKTCIDFKSLNNIHIVETDFLNTGALDYKLRYMTNRFCASPVAQGNNKALNSPSLEHFTNEQSQQGVADVEAAGHIGKVNFNIGESNNHLCRLVLYKTQFQPGETVLLSLDFSKAQSICVAVFVGLEEEEVRIEPPPLRAAFVPLTPDLDIDNVDKLPWKKVTAATHSVVRDFQLVSLKLRIPETTIPSFKTDLVQLKHMLKFEFAILSAPEERTGSPQHNGLLERKQCTWDLPVVIAPPSSFIQTLAYDRSTTRREDNAKELDEVEIKKALESERLTKMVSLMRHGQESRRKVWL